jgi:hypothetical protein
MLKLLGFIVKVALFSLVVLIIGNWARWDGKTISDQVKTQLSAAQRLEIAEQIKEITKKVTGDAKKGLQKIKTNGGRSSLPSSAKEEKTALARSTGIPSPDTEEPISASERQKLRALIRELNHSQP